METAVVPETGRACKQRQTLIVLGKPRVVRMALLVLAVIVFTLTYAGVRRIAAISSVVLAWLCANGMAWNALQLVAWSKMFASYSENMPFAQALGEALDPTKPCDMCVGIAKARSETEKKLPSSELQAAAKLVLIVHAAEPLVFSAPRDEWNEVGSRTGPQRDRPVLRRPPRANPAFA
jgi:hypothetical protein